MVDVCNKETMTSELHKCECVEHVREIPCGMEMGTLYVAGCILHDDKVRENYMKMASKEKIDINKKF